MSLASKFKGAVAQQMQQGTSPLHLAAQQGQTAVVATLVGPPGMGKTAFARKMAAEFREAERFAEHRKNGLGLTADDVAALNGSADTVSIRKKRMQL